MPPATTWPKPTNPLIVYHIFNDLLPCCRFVSTLIFITNDDSASDDSVGLAVALESEVDDLTVQRDVSEFTCLVAQAKQK